MINSLVGSLTPLLYKYEFNSVGNGGGRGDWVVVNYHARNDFNLSTFVEVGFGALNRSSSLQNYVPHLLELIGNNLPYKLRVLQTSTGSYATFALNGDAGVPPYGASRRFSSTFLSSESTATTFAKEDFLHVLFVPVAAPPPPVVIPETVHRSVATQCDALVINYSAQTSTLTTSTTAEGSLNVQVNDADGWNSVCVFFPKTNVWRGRNDRDGTSAMFAIQLTGSGWAFQSLDALWAGFSTEATFHNLQSTFTSGLHLSHDFVYDTGSNRRQVMARFFAGVGRRSPNNTTPGVNRTGYTTDSLAAVSDVLVCVLKDGNDDFQLQWFSSADFSTPKSVVSFSHTIAPSTVGNWDNTVINPVVPTVSVNNKGASFAWRILSSRDMSALGIVMNHSNVFF